mmetsp:Transcript_4618/g.17434  ORF Transcript_4618/g.17434 Transcript_4618/m.17434 type:complete len:83 (+) Transcript_4618:972-1220(+)
MNLKAETRLHISPRFQFIEDGFMHLTRVRDFQLHMAIQLTDDCFRHFKSVRRLFLIQCCIGQLSESDLHTFASQHKKYCSLA